MGGFVFEADNSLVNFFPDSLTRMTLLPCALRKMAHMEPMSVPDLSKRTIEDKSKANWLAKALVCLQACWFIVQVVGRSSTSAPISLLEMNTFLHAICCLIIYLAWWYKPLDISEPDLNAEPIRKLCAWMIMNSELGACRLLKNELTGLTTNGKGYLVHMEDLYEKDTFDPVSEYFDHHKYPKPEDSSNDVLHQRAEAEEGPTTPLRLYPGQSIHRHYLILPEDQDGLNNTYLTLDTATLECLRLVDLLRTESGANDIWKTDWKFFYPRFRPLLVSHISDFDDIKDYRLAGLRGSNVFSRKLDTDYFLSMMLLVAGSVYGLVHLIAWNGPFTTLTQRWMWRVSCLIIASPTVVVAIIYLAVKSNKAIHPKSWAYIIFAPVRLSGKLLSAMFPVGSLQLNIAVDGLWGILVLTYLAARVYLLVECFINLSQLPPEVYQVPQWSQYIPHLGAG
ncbi:hypothetical protein OPT61_g6083 [Boeremia exigua]|uniref:Uncharacterized protein n=1 Tax=Boeremia exigua TaxID=749465 RepID=A0ACC2I7Z8_9PLEO|nr:hypothetical protein OPT61_g6083 [Boeremia exigua]